MRKFAFIAYLVFANLFAEAQIWAPVGAKWTYTLSFAMSGDRDTLMIRSVGDTTIQGKHCRILKKTTFLCDFRGIKEYMYSENGKVFFFDLSRSRFQMLFNINADTGDSWVWFPRDLPYRDSIVVKVDSLSTTSINSKTLKEVFVKYFFSSPWSPHGGGRIIENIGDSYYLFPWVFGACNVMFGGPLRCYDDSIIGHYETGVVSDCNYRFIGINEKIITRHPLNISPNPFTHSFTLEKLNGGDPDSDFIEIFNFLGERVLTEEFRNRIGIFNLQDQPDGVYFLKVQMNGKSSFLKIVKQ